MNGETSLQRPWALKAATFLIVPFDVFVQQFLPVLFADATMYSDFAFQIRKCPLQCVVGVRKSCLRIIVECP